MRSFSKFYKNYWAVFDSVNGVGFDFLSTCKLTYVNPTIITSHIYLFSNKLSNSLHAPLIRLLFLIPLLTCLKQSEAMEYATIQKIMNL